MESVKNDEILELGLVDSLKPEKDVCQWNLLVCACLFGSESDEIC